MMLARNSTSSEHSSFLPSSESSIKNEASSSHETEYSPPTTINGSDSPKSSIDENAGNETVNSSPSTTPNLMVTSCATTAPLLATTSARTTTTARDLNDPMANSTTASQLLFGGLKNSTQLPALDINSVFGNILCANSKLSNFLSEQKPSSTTPANTPPNYGVMNGIVDPTAFLQHFLAAQPPPQQQPPPQTVQQGQPPSTMNEKSEFKQENDQGNNLQDRKRSYPYTFQYCVLCQKNVHSSKLPCHIRQCHVAKPMFQCPTCDFTSTYSKNNVKSHMVSLHGLAGDPISYMDQYAGEVEEFMKKCFPNVRGRGRPVHGRASPSVSAALAVNASNALLHNLGADKSPSSPFNGTPLNNNNKLDTIQRNGSSHKNAQQRYKATNINNNNNNNNNGTPNAAARFNEMYTMAMLGNNNTNKIFNNEKFVFNPLAANPNNDFPLQNLNPLLCMQQINGQTPEPPKLKYLKGENLEEKPFSFNLVADYMGGMEQFFKNLNQTFDQNGEVMLKNPIENNNSKKQKSFNPNNESNKLTSMVDNVDPRYLPQNLKWTVLDSNQLNNTVFKTFTNSSELIEKLDLSLFETLLDKSNSFLTKKQLERIGDVRQKLGLKSFEIMFAVHRLDLQVLKAEDVKLVEGIAPTDVDIRRFSLYEQSNSITSLNENEQFILQLSKIDRLKEKLAVMSFMGNFNEKIVQVNQQLCDCVNASKMLQNSSEFHTILHLLLTFGNLINGDFNAQLIEGFRPSRIREMCEFQFPNGITLLDALIARIEKFTVLKKFQEQCIIVEEASKVEFSSILHNLQEFEDGQRLVELELQMGGSNQVLSNFLTHCENEIAQLKEIINLAKDQIVAMLHFFGEPVFREHGELFQFKPEEFFATISEFAKSLQTAFNMETS